MEKEIYILRHGRTEYNKLGIWQGSGVDASLDELGHQQAASFYNYYKNLNFDMVIHSALSRSRETVAPFAAYKIPFIEEDKINEISWGIFEGKPHTEESFAAYKNVVSAWSREEYHVGFEGGESAADLRSRLGEFVDYLSALQHERILVCSHGRAIRALLCLMKNEPLKEMEKYEHANTGLFKAKYSNGKFTFSDYNNTDHLISES